MQGLAGVLRLGPVYRYKKAERRDFLLSHFADREFVERVVAQLEPQEHTALRDVLAHGGVMDREGFVATYGDDLEERPYLEHHGERWKSVIGRLRACALLFEGTSENGLIVAIPRELRPVWGELLEDRS